MTALSLPFSPEACTEAFQAELKLAELTENENLAVFAETAPTPALREHYAESYRQVMGVWPEQRQILREALQRVCEQHVA